MGITFAPIGRDGMPLPYDEELHTPQCNTGNQALVLRVLGYTPVDDDCGDCEPGDLYARCTLALAMLDDLGTDELEPRTVGGNWHECGRAPGYVIAKMHELREFATACAALGCRVQWT